MSSNFKKIAQLCLPCCLIIAWLFLIDYNNFISKNNISAFLGVAAMIFIIFPYFFNKRKI